MTGAQPQVRRTEPIGLVVAAIGGLRQLIPAVIALAFVMRDEVWLAAAVLPAVALLLLANLGAAWLQWHRFTYIVGEDDIRVESGVLSRTARSVPYERIQDVSLEQGPLARIFGLVQVQFETGAGGKDELALKYLTEEQGEALRETVRERKDGAAPATGDEGAAGIAPPLFAMGPKRVLTFGLFEFSLAVVAVVAGAAQQFEWLLPFDIWDLEDWQHRLAGPGAWLAGIGPFAQAVGVALAILSLLLVGFVTGLVRTVLRDWGFTLEKTAKGFRRRRGLLTRSDVVMPVHRVQAVRIGTRILRRRFGWHALKFVSLAQDKGSSSHVVAPFAKMPEIAPIARAAGFALPGEQTDWRRPSGQYRFDTALIEGGTLLVLGLILLVASSVSEVPWFAALPLLVLAPLLALRQAFLWSYERHALGPHQLFHRRGWLAPGLIIASRIKLQSVEIARGPVAQRRGYATLHLGLAGDTLSLPGLPAERAGEIRDALLASMTGTDFSELAG